jgi:hypothetical protein
MPSLNSYEPAIAVDYNGPQYYQQLDVVVVDLIRQVESDMQRQPAHMVYEMITTSLHGRLPGVPFNDAVVQDAAARISAGVPALWPLWRSRCRSERAPRRGVRTTAGRGSEPVIA